MTDLSKDVEKTNEGWDDAALTLIEARYLWLARSWLGSGPESWLLWSDS